MGAVWSLDEDATPPLHDARLEFHFNEPHFTDIANGTKSVHFIPGSDSEYIAKIGGPVAIYQDPTRNNSKYLVVRLKNVKHFTNLAQCISEENSSSESSFTYDDILPHAENRSAAMRIYQQMLIEAGFSANEDHGGITALIFEKY